MPHTTQRQSYHHNHHHPYGQYAGRKATHTRSTNQSLRESGPAAGGSSNHHASRDPPPDFVPVRPRPTAANQCDHTPPANPPSTSSRDVRGQSGAERYRAQAAANRRLPRRQRVVCPVEPPLDDTPEPWNNIQPPRGQVDEAESRLFKHLERMKLDRVFFQQLAEQRAIVERVASKRAKRTMRREARDAAAAALAAEREREELPDQAAARAEMLRQKRQEEEEVRQRAEEEAKRAQRLREIEQIHRERVREILRKTEEILKEKRRKREEAQRRETERKRAQEELRRQEARRAEESRRQSEESERHRRSREQREREAAARRAQQIFDELRRSQEEARKTAAAAEEAMLENTFRQYHERWDVLLNSDAHIGPIHGDQIPWPTHHLIQSLEDITVERVSEFLFHPVHLRLQEKTRKEMLKWEVRKYHSDKFTTKVLPRVVDWQRDLARQAAEAFTKCITQLIVQARDR
ncbi:hypothetical protein CERSUDRAFT_119264 [Gelatoporia subvermispora B]|uniref:Uncharacterized protein n=1 Tax=Ceriporiopsis subvermispora (strain B) TaxID=914234 RepID=M2Q572_CERS8|nr:hypothetical protein CERSUDRAFT_119264 [Gelatoporia subvermispora B]